MKIKSIIGMSVIGAAMIMPATLNAAVSQQEAKKLGSLLTPMGGERAGNADGSIPAWSGSMSGVPKGLPYRGSGDVYPDPYGKEKPLYIVSKANIAAHKDKLTPGLIAMFEQYPDTFNMPIYPSHRDARWSRLAERRTMWNSVNTVLINGIDGLQNYTGAAPFPIPKDGVEVMWNARITHPSPTLVGTMDDVAVYLNGESVLLRQDYVSEFPYSYPQNKIGDTEDQIGINGGLVHVTIQEPKRQKGQMTVVHEAMDQVQNERKAWVYIPGTRRVRRAPTVGFDTPNGPGGIVTVDDALGFNGAMVRYNWKLVGKKEMYIPYHSYRFDSPKIDYSMLLMPGHVNPKYMRYELHRVWIVEANLKDGKRHVYGKRRWYIDEDSWQISLLESYDGRGELWKVGVLNTVYDFALKGYIARAQIFHDLKSGSYISMRMVNETAQPNLMATPRGEQYYSPASLRKMGTR